MKTLTSFLFVLTLTLSSFAQKENYIWYFGDHAGIDFKTDPPTPLTDGAMQSYEGSSIACDALGNLLFYTNGGSFSTAGYSGGIWNKNHVLMPSGNLSSSGGCNSALQACLIVPKPGSSTQYYVITNDCNENSYTGGTRYNLVDMTLDSGNGDVTTQNTLIQGNSNESMIGIRHSNGSDYWVIVHENTSAVFHSILISSTGISNTVTSSSSMTMPQYGGQLAVNSDRTKVVYTSVVEVYLYDFNNSTGAISNAVNLGMGGVGAAFSSNDKFLYVMDVMNKQLCQFDMQAGNIPASKTIVGTTLGNYGVMQLAPDCKIYAASGTSGYDDSLAVINSPNLAGLSCDFKENDFYLGGKKSVFGLPNFVNNFFTCSSVFIDNGKQVNNKTEIVLYPNPSPGQTDLTSSRNLKDGRFYLYNCMGKIIIELPGINGNIIPIKNVTTPAGIYYYQLIDKEGNISSGKLVIE
jgi:hypothetical protein